MTVRFDDPVRQEIRNTVRAMNDAWTRGDPADLVRFFHRDMVAITPVDRARRNGGATCVAGWTGFGAAAGIHRRREVDPVVHVCGDAAVVAYDYGMSFDMGGRTIDAAGRDMFFFAKENGRWGAVADHFSPGPD